MTLRIQEASPNKQDCDQSSDHHHEKSRGKTKIIRKTVGEEEAEEDFKNTEYFLEVTVLHATNIDPNDLDKVLIKPGYQDRRGYMVLLWIEQYPEELYDTPIRETPMHDPEWNWRHQIPIEPSMIQGSPFLYLEVLRYGQLNEVGTSTGKRIVGRAKIPLPRAFEKINNHVPLVMEVESGCRDEGFISVDMKLWRRRRRMFNY